MGHREQAWLLFILLCMKVSINKQKTKRQENSWKPIQ